MGCKAQKYGEIGGNMMFPESLEGPYCNFCQQRRDYGMNQQGMAPSPMQDKVSHRIAMTDQHVQIGQSTNASAEKGGLAGAYAAARNSNRYCRTEHDLSE